VGVEMAPGWGRGDSRTSLLSIGGRGI